MHQGSLWCLYLLQIQMIVISFLSEFGLGLRDLGISMAVINFSLGHDKKK